ncbi:MAG: phytanoyl-CoA dioxygenase family protein [Chitinophagales bacterium]|nr:phytanoyl-CoA dioxygenase family protein [Chitinophagales bacterium]
MRPLFSNPEHQAFFEENGYLLIEDMLSSEDVQDLSQYYSELNNDHVNEYGFHVSMDNRSYDFVSGVINKLEAVIFPKAEKYFVPCKMFTASFVVKEPRVNSFVPPHQDWSFTNDVEYNSVTVWTALQDTDINNGAMAVLPGSHKWFTGPRASPSPGYKTPFQAHGMDLFPFMKLIPMKAGQSLIFENKTLHASPPNNSKVARIGAGIGITQKEAPLLHYYVIPGSEPQQLQAYHVDRDYFFKYSNKILYGMQAEGKFPEGYEKAGTVINDPHICSKEELEKMAIDAGLQKDPVLDQYLQGFYQYMASMGNNQYGSNQESQSDKQQSNDSQEGNVSFVGKLKGLVKRLIRA